MVTSGTLGSGGRGGELESVGEAVRSVGAPQPRHKSPEKTGELVYGGSKWSVLELGAAGIVRTRVLH